MPTPGTRRGLARVNYVDAISCPACFPHLLGSEGSPTSRPLNHPPLDSHTSKTVFCSDLSPKPASVLHSHSKRVCMTLLFPEFSRIQLPYNLRDMVLCSLWGSFKNCSLFGENHITQRSALSHQQDMPKSVCIRNCIHGEFIYRRSNLTASSDFPV